VLLRTEVPGPLAGWPVPFVVWADAPARRLDDVAARLGRVRHVRLCATLASTPGLLVVAWLRSLDDVHGFEQTLVQRVPEVEVTGRSVVLRTVKRMGRLLDEDGCAVGVVPMDVWGEPVPGRG
jgi:hypothetical protein